MISSVTLNDHTGSPVTIHLDTSTSKAFASQALGLIGGVVSAPRQNKSVRPQAHGAINNTKYSDGSSISLACEVQGTSIEDALLQFRTISAVCQQTLDFGPALLKWTEGVSGLQLQRLVTLDGPIDPPVSDGAAKLTFQLQFFAEDPRAYSQTATTVTSRAIVSLLANPDFTHDTVGTAPAHWTNETGNFSTYQVANVTFGAGPTSAPGLRLTTNSLTSATAKVICDKFAITAANDYAVSAWIQSAVVPVGWVVLLNWALYDASGTLLTFGTVDSFNGTGSSLSTVLNAWLPFSLWGSSFPTATQATVELQITNPTSTPGTATLNLMNVAASAPAVVTVTNNGTRDTPLTIALTAVMGRCRVYFGSALVFDLSNQAWDYGPAAATLTIDTGARKISDSFGDSLLSYLVASSAVWKNLSTGALTITVTGLQTGGTFSVSERDAY